MHEDGVLRLRLGLLLHADVGQAGDGADFVLQVPGNEVVAEEQGEPDGVFGHFAIHAPPRCAARPGRGSPTKTVEFPLAPGVFVGGAVPGQNGLRLGGKRKKLPR